MRETVSEYGLILVGCIVAGVLIPGCIALFRDSEVWKTFVDLYISAAYGM